MYSALCNRTGVALCYDTGAYYCYQYTDLMLLPITFFLLGSPAAIYWFVRIITRWNVPWFEGREITRIEFPLPPLVPNALELIPVAMMVGSNTEAKRCAYCHEEFDAGSARRFCSSCGSATHQECATLNEGCNVYGCSGTFCQ